MKPLNSGHLRVFKVLSVIKRCPLVGGGLTKLSHLGQNILSAIQGMSAIWDIRYWEVSLYYLVSIKIRSHLTAQKMKFSIKDFLSKCDQIHKKLRIWSHFLMKLLRQNFILQCLCKPNLVTFFVILDR